MPTKIPVNGFGRIGRMAMMATTWPYLLQRAQRLVTQSIEAEELREMEEIDRRHGLVRESQTYTLTRHPDNSFTFYPKESAITDVCIDGKLPKQRYHDRTFPKDYAKKKKAKRRQQKQARRNHK